MDVDVMIADVARGIAHKHCPRCTGGTGYGPGGDGPRYHSKACDALASDIQQVLHATWKLTSLGSDTLKAPPSQDDTQ